LIIPEDDPGILKDFEVAAVGNLKFGVAVRTGEDHLLSSDGIADGESPRNVIAQDRDLPGHDQDAGGTAEGCIGRAVGAWRWGGILCLRKGGGLLAGRRMGPRSLRGHTDSQGQQQHRKGTIPAKTV
jgi:hypothetical protein